MLAKARNIVFVTIAALAFLGTAGNIALTSAGIIEPIDFSYLEGRAYQTPPEVSIERVANKEFQNQAERFLADSTPFRNDILLGSASIQQAIIETSSVPFGYSTFHSFFGASYAYNNNYGCVFDLPMKKSDWWKGRLNQTAILVTDLVNNNPHIRWRMALVDRDKASESNPAHNLVSNTIDSGFFETEFYSRLPDACETIDLTYGDIESYYADYYYSDHHWRMSGAAKAYEAVIASFGFDPIDYELVPAFSKLFYGSEARGGRVTKFSDQFYDVSYKRSPALSVTVENAKQPISYLDSGWDKTFENFEGSNKFENLYGVYFHGDPGQIAIANKSAESDKTLLIIGDSYSNCIERLFAEHYRNVFVLDPRFMSTRISDFIDSHDIDDAVFIWSIDTLDEGKAKAAWGLP